MNKRLSVIYDDDDGHEVSYAEAAKRLHIDIRTFYVRLSMYRKAHYSDEIMFSELKAPGAVRNRIVNHWGERVSYADAADYLKVSRTLIYRLINELRTRFPDVRTGCDLAITKLEHFITEDGKISRDALEPQEPPLYIPDASTMLALGFEPNLKGGWRKPTT